MRSGNQIVATNEFRETIESEFFRQNSEHVINTLPAILNDPSVRGRIAAGTSIVAISELLPVRSLANLFETLGAFVKRGMIDRDLACDLWGAITLRAWEAAAPLARNIRLAYGNEAIWENFEYLAAASRAFARKHPDGTYPKGMPREEMPEVWPELMNRHDDA
ncbi:MAG: hypothetical protein JO177_01010 [Candidatus Eremiobacteraeota bacterium]|nr:hypothetical protein [Candidatus Eremiobacteraeota bacterium]